MSFNNNFPEYLYHHHHCIYAIAALMSLRSVSSSPLPSSLPSCYRHLIRTSSGVNTTPIAAHYAAHWHHAFRMALRKVLIGHFITITMSVHQSTSSVNIAITSYTLARLRQRHLRVSFSRLSSYFCHAQRAIIAADETRE